MIMIFILNKVSVIVISNHSHNNHDYDFSPNKLGNSYDCDFILIIIGC